MVVIAGRRECPWHPVGRGQDAAKHLTVAQDGPAPNGYPAPNVSSAEAEPRAAACRVRQCTACRKQTGEAHKKARSGEALQFMPRIFFHRG